MDRVAAERRRPPMVRIDKDYFLVRSVRQPRRFDLFEGRTQLIVYHFMFDPVWEKGCPGCPGFVDALGDLSMLAQRNTAFALISLSPFAKLDSCRSKRGWKRPARHSCRRWANAHKAPRPMTTPNQANVVGHVIGESGAPPHISGPPRPIAAPRPA